MTDSLGHMYDFFEKKLYAILEDQYPEEKREDLFIAADTAAHQKIKAMAEMGSGSQRPYILKLERILEKLKKPMKMPQVTAAAQQFVQIECDLTFGKGGDWAVYQSLLWGAISELVRKYDNNAVYSRTSKIFAKEFLKKQVALRLATIKDAAGEDIKKFLSQLISEFDIEVDLEELMGHCHPGDPPESFGPPDDT